MKVKVSIIAVRSNVCPRNPHALRNPLMLEQSLMAFLLNPQNKLKIIQTVLWVADCLLLAVMGQ